jgi:hypothetical protein
VSEPLTPEEQERLDDEFVHQWRGALAQGIGLSPAALVAVRLHDRMTLDATRAAELTLDVERPWREALWSMCPHDGKYGDDGEMQCRGYDFLRADRWSLVDHVRAAIIEKRSGAES